MLCAVPHWAETRRLRARSTECAGSRAPKHHNLCVPVAAGRPNGYFHGRNRRSSGELGLVRAEERVRTLSKLVVGLVAGLLPGLAGAETPKSGGTLTFAVTAEAPSTDCHAITTYAAVHVLAPHYSLLLKVDPDNYPKLKPDIAESWSVSPDGLAYTFKVRQGVVFHDGSPLTSADVKATFDRIRNPPAGIVSIR